MHSHVPLVVHLPFEQNLEQQSMFEEQSSSFCSQEQTPFTHPVGQFSGVHASHLLVNALQRFEQQSEAEVQEELVWLQGQTPSTHPTGQFSGVHASHLLSALQMFEQHAKVGEHVSPAVLQTSEDETQVPSV
ncbi:MAG: hypothetical protein ABIH99_03525 [Candidatus Micrarchaeota archaeon]